MSDRLQRLLLVVPAVRARPGIPLRDLAELLRCDLDELRGDITLLSMVGAAPFNPDDLIELTIQDDRVFLRLAPAFDRPTRLAATEAAALVAACRALAPEHAVVEGAVKKLESAVATPHRDLYEGIVARVAAVPDVVRPDVLRTCERAVKERRLLDIDYFAKTELAARPRRVRPRAVSTYDGVRYLSARNELGDERTYRMDRIASARLTDETFEPLPPIDVAAQLSRTVSLERSAELPRAVVRFSREVATSVRARHPDAIETEHGLEAQVPYSTLPWLVSYALSWGGHARVKGPSEAADAFQDAVRRAVAAHTDLTEST